MTTALIGLGAELWMASATNVLTKVAEVIEVGLPNPQTDDVDATHFESPGRQREYIAGLIDNGEVNFRINWLPGSATDTLIAGAQAAGATRDMEVLIPKSPTAKEKFAFAGIVKGFEKDVPIDDRMTATITVRVSGAVTQSEDTP